MEIVGLLLLIVSLFLMSAANKSNRDETGVNGPSRGAMRNIRRNARKKGISEADAYASWLNRKQKRAFKPKL